MAQGRIAELPRRAVVAVGGQEAEKFLDGLVTNDMAAVPAGGAAYGGLLTPQGKILFDFLVFREGERFLVDLARDSIADFTNRLGFYRLRAKVEIAGQERERAVAPGSQGVVFEMDLPAGPTELLTYLYDNKGKAGGAYFTDVEWLD